MRKLNEQEMKNELVRYLLRNKVYGAKNQQRTTVVNQANFPVHEQGNAKQVLDDMVTDPKSPIVQYGGSRNCVQLVSKQDGIEYLKDNGGDVPFGMG